MYYGGCQGGYQSCCNNYPNYQPYSYYPCSNMNDGFGNNFAIILVLFILLVIILNNKSCN